MDSISLIVIGFLLVSIAINLNCINSELESLKKELSETNEILSHVVGAELQNINTSLEKGE